MARRKQRQQQEHQNHDRWLVSYADFITLLFAFFVVMYSISSVNDGKYRVLSDTLIAAFNTPPKSVMPINVGKTSTSSQLVKDNNISLIDLKPVTSQSSGILEEIEEDLQENLKQLIDDKTIKITRNKQWIEVEMDSSIIYTSGSANLEIDAIPILQTLARLLAPLPNFIEVEGHTDNVPIHTVFYPSNWELSAARSARVVNLFTNSGIEASKLSAIGYGEFRPVESNNTVKGRKSNRRVVVVIRKNKNYRRSQQFLSPNKQHKTISTEN